MTFFEIFATPAGTTAGTGFAVTATVVAGLVALKKFQDRSITAATGTFSRSDVRKEAAAQVKQLGDQQGHRKNGQWDFRSRRDGSL